MAAAFRPVNTPLLAADSIKEEIPASSTTSTTTMTTPRPSTAPSQASRGVDEAATPTRASFGTGALASQKPLPTSPFPESVQVPEPTTESTPKRENSQHSRKSRDSDDMDMDDSDGEGHGEDGAGSDDDSENADGTKSKKKKSQRFYCTDYPPCNLSFTRSEHLARHIRKHTGERPFQCHCSRRFSRLDNLRQHAQTVHVNEDIPIDSLAATGTRFQRQIRTDRVRPTTGRARASTAGSVGPGGRGHSKSLSTSSITSMASIASTYGGGEARRRPPPLVMADPRSRLSLEPYRGPDGQYYRPASPSDFSTPTSATFSTGQNSPRWGSVASPGSSHSRSHSMYAAGSRTPGRRLSVPSGGNPFQSPHGPGLRGPLFGPTLNASNSGAFSPGQSSLLSSPTTSTASWSRRDSVSAADEAWRRRTWHPDMRDYNGASRLSQVITPSQFPPDNIKLPPANTENQPPQTLRLPGIESFDPIPGRPPTPPRRNPSPMMIDSEVARPPTLLPAGDLGSDDRRPTSQWDMGLHRGITRLDINTPPRDSAGAWANEANQALMARAEQAHAAPIQPTVRFEQDARPPQGPPPVNAPPPVGSRHHYTMSAPSISTPRESRRHGWYHGPVTTHPVEETIHEGRPHVDRIVHPNVRGFQGFPAREQQPVIHQQQSSGPSMERIMERPMSRGDNPESLRRLQALVAVATSEGSTATAY
ncbi:hypothetical protein B0T21DRAFT_352358 [Apiosordaria backusii]|uniref:C2H2-type domain-containing protein n=1 Tax=Apiosordaria backusii TaxID=314023 RepID=A0AA40DV00_9PEZI|nr:hypothetical protein B0T21DRAFT_352358 [Apiosordaria backusii]